MISHYSRQLPDIDPTETKEWIDSLDSVVGAQGAPRARYIVAKLLERANELHVGVPPTTSTPYINTIPAEEQPFFPGNEDIERRIRACMRWNAAPMAVAYTHPRAHETGRKLACRLPYEKKYLKINIKKKPPQTITQ
mgnify:CR=1 FL=1